MALQHFIQKGGKTYGPLSSSDLMKLAQSGKLMPNDLVWSEGSETKVRAEQVKGLLFKSPQVVPPNPAEDDPFPEKDNDFSYRLSFVHPDFAKHNPSPEKDNVPPVRSEPNNSNDQREFHYEINGENQGPISFLKLQELVQQGVVKKETQVWHDGLEDWTPASEIDELAARFSADAKKAPPPLPKKTPTSLPVTKHKLGGLLALVALVVLIFGFFAFRSHVRSEARRKEAEADRELRRSVRDAERAIDDFLGR